LEVVLVANVSSEDFDLLRQTMMIAWKMKPCVDLTENVLM